MQRVDKKKLQESPACVCVRVWIEASDIKLFSVHFSAVQLLWVACAALRLQLVYMSLCVLVFMLQAVPTDLFPGPSLCNGALGCCELDT